MIFNFLLNWAMRVTKTIFLEIRLTVTWHCVKSLCNRTTERSMTQTYCFSLIRLPHIRTIYPTSGPFTPHPDHLPHIRTIYATSWPFTPHPDHLPHIQTIYTTYEPFTLCAFKSQLKTQIMWFLGNCWSSIILISRTTISRTKISRTKISRPKINRPKISWLKISRPKISWPKISHQKLADKN